MSADDACPIPPQTFVQCGTCEGSTNISWFCKNCQTSLCDACAEAHKNAKQFKSHTVVKRTYTVLRLFGSAKIAEQCQIHPEKDIALYCNECEVPCCPSCLVEYHQRHEISKIEDKYKDAETRLNDYANQLDSDVIPTLEKMEDNTKANIKEENDIVEIVINDINDFRRNVIQNFNKSCDNLITEVKSISSRYTKKLLKLQNLKKKTESLKNEIDQKVKRGKLDIIRYKTPKIESLVPTLKSPSNIVPIFKPAMKVLEVMEGSVGEIQFKEFNRKEKGIVRYKILRSLHVQKLHSFHSKIDVISMTTAGNSMAWVMGSDHPSINLYNAKGEVVRSVAVMGSKGINDMAITQLGEMIVACQDKKVRRVSVSGDVSTLIDTTPFRCEGLCVNCKQEIVVCMNNQGDKNHVAVYSPDGRSKLREIRGRDGQGKHLIINPYRVVQNDEDLCVVNDGGNVICVDEKENVRWMYDGKQVYPDNLFAPCGICVDKYNNLLITDFGNSCVHYIDRDGGLVQVILTQEQIGSHSHWGICVDDSTGHVWVGNIYKLVVIARYLN